MRALVPTFVGVSHAVRREPTYDTIWAFVPGGESREAQWQLRDSVSRLTLVAAHREPDARRRRGLREVGVRSGAFPVEAARSGLLRRTCARRCKTGDFFSAPGDYRIELRSGGKTIAFATLTIAESFETAVVNACEVVKDQ